MACQEKKITTEARRKNLLYPEGALHSVARASGRAEGSGLICIPALPCRAINGRPSLRDSIFVLATFLFLPRKVGRADMFATSRPTSAKAVVKESQDYC